MSAVTPPNLLVVITASLFLLGTITFSAGVLVLIFRATSSDVKTLAVQTARLAQKGLTEDIVGLVGNASKLMEAMNQLVRTTAGVGVFLTMLGTLLMGIACWLAINIYQVSL